MSLYNRPPSIHAEPEYRPHWRRPGRQLVSGQWGLARLALFLVCLAGMSAGMPPPRVAAQAFPAAGQLAELAAMLNREGTYVAPRVRQQVPVTAEEQLQT